MSSRATERAARLLVAAAVAVSGCGMRQVGEGAAPAGKARFPTIAVVSQFTGQGRAGDEVFDVSAWDVGGKAARIVAETLSATGGAAIPVQVPASPADSGSDWAAQALAAARSAGKLPPGVPVLLLREARVNEDGVPEPTGTEPSRAAGYAVTGLMAVAAGFALAAGTGAWILIPADAGDPFGASRRHGTYHQAITLRRDEHQATCATGLSMRLVGPDGATLSSADTVLGQEVLPRLPAAARWADMTPADRATIETWCLASLRRSVLLAVRAADLVR